MLLRYLIHCHPLVSRCEANIVISVVINCNDTKSSNVFYIILFHNFIHQFVKHMFLKQECKRLMTDQKKTKAPVISVWSIVLDDFCLFRWVSVLASKTLHCSNRKVTVLTVTLCLTHRTRMWTQHANMMEMSHRKQALTEEINILSSAVMIRLLLVILPL